MDLPDDYFFLIFSHAVQIFLDDVPVARIRLAETPQRFALQFFDSFTELFICTKPMIEIFSVPVKRISSRHSRFQSERITKITIHSMSCSAYIGIIGFFADIDYSCSTHNHLLFSVKHLPAREPIFYFLPASLSRAGLCKAFRKNTASGARKIFAETRKGPALLNPDRHGTNFAGGNKKTVFQLLFIVLAIFFLWYQVFQVGVVLYAVYLILDYLHYIRLDL